MLADLFEKLDLVARIRPFHYKDPVVGSTIGLTVSQHYSVLRIDDRAYYFNKDGTFDGSSIDCHGDEV